jgi:hypothetical protein
MTSCQGFSTINSHSATRRRGRPVPSAAAGPYQRLRIRPTIESYAYVCAAAGSLLPAQLLLLLLLLLRVYGLLVAV